MSTALTKAVRRSDSIALSAYDCGTKAKISGASPDFTPSSPMAGMAGWQNQQAHAEQYSYMREWVYAAINALASEGAGQPAVVARLSGAKAKTGPEGKKSWELNRMTRTVRQKAASVEYEIQEDHPLVDLLNHPNEFQEKWQFVYSFFANLVLTGMAYVTVGWSKRHKKMELYSLPSTWVKPNHEQGLFSRFEIKNPKAIGTKPVMLDRSQVGFAMLPNPGDPLAVLAPASSQLRTLRMHEHMLNGQEAFFKNGIHPSVIVTMAQGPYQNTKGRPVLTNVQRRMIYHALRQNVMGDVNQGTAFIVDGMVESMKPFSLKSREMGWDKTEERIKSRLLSAFGVHEFILGGVVTVGGYAQAEIIETRFYKRVNTYLDMLSNLLTNLLGSIEGDDRMLVWFEECQSFNPERRTSTFLTMRSSGDISQNELRAEMGLPPDEDLNQAVIQPSMMAGVTQVLTLLGQGAVQREQAVATMVGMGIPTKLAEEIAGIGLPEPEPPPPPEPPKLEEEEGDEDEEDKDEEEKPEEGEDVSEVTKELRLTNLLLAKALEPPEQQAGRILESVGCCGEKHDLKHESHDQSTHGQGGGGRAKPESKPSSGPRTISPKDKAERRRARKRDRSASEELDEVVVDSRGKLPRGAKKEIRSYTGDTGAGGIPNYDRVNKEMRSGKSFSEIKPPPNIAALQGFASQKLEKSTMVYRGVSQSRMEKLVGKDSVVGTEIKLKGFVSTSLDPVVSTDFGSGKAKAVMEIRAKTGIPVSDVSKYPGEYEVIQAHGTKYRFLGKGEKKLRGSTIYMFEEI